jgi:hypothetical protein
MREFTVTIRNFPTLATYDVVIITEENIFLTKEVKKKVVNKIGAPEE